MQPTETRTDRIARVRAFVESYLASGYADVAIEGEATPSGIVELRVEDVAWLLSQIGADVEYRIEVRAIDSTGEPVSAWVGYGGLAPMRSLPEADVVAVRKTISQGDDPAFQFRVTSAPVQAWTPVEEEHP